MKGIFKSNYVKDGEPRAVYIVKGTEKELAAYKAAVESDEFTMAVDEASGQPVFFGKRLGPVCTIKVSDSGYVDAFNADVEAVEEMLGMFSDPIMKQQIAKASAEKLIAERLGRRTSSASAPIAQAAPATEEKSTEEADAKPEL